MYLPVLTIPSVFFVPIPQDTKEQKEALHRKVAGRRKVGHGIFKPPEHTCSLFHYILYSRRHWGVWWGGGGQQPLGLLQSGFKARLLANTYLFVPDSAHASFTISTVAANKVNFGSWGWKDVCCGEGGVECHGPHLRIAASVQTQKQ